MDRELISSIKISTIDEEQKPKVLAEIFYPPFTTGLELTPIYSHYPKALREACH